MSERVWRPCAKHRFLQKTCNASKVNSVKRTYSGGCARDANKVESEEVVMRYEEFRDRLQDALRDVGLVFQHIGQPSETIDLSSGARHCELYIRAAFSGNGQSWPWIPPDIPRCYWSLCVRHMKLLDVRLSA